MRARRFWAVLGSLALVAGVAAPSSAVTATTPLPVPTSMAALGDSITIAYDIKSLLKADPTYSWSTGTQAAVTSVYARLEARDTTSSIKRDNYAVSGARIGDLASQGATVTQGTDLVTILMGANDACTKTEAEMTPVADFRTRADSALTVLAGKGVKQVVVASIPDVYKLWQVGKGSSSARFVWGLYGICQSMLKSPTSKLKADVDRRDRVRARVVAFNRVLAEECAAIACPDTGDECSTPSGYEPPDLPTGDDTSALVAHGGGGDLADCGFDTGLAFDPWGGTLQLQSLDGNVCARLERGNEGAGELANVEWSLLEMRVGPLGGVSLVDDPEDLCWYSSHHNLFDWAHAWTGGARYDLSLEDEHAGEWSYSLIPYGQGPVDPAACSPTTDGSAPIGEAITLYPYAP